MKKSLLVSGRDRTFSSFHKHAIHSTSCLARAIPLLQHVEKEASPAKQHAKQTKLATSRLIMPCHVTSCHVTRLEHHRGRKRNRREGGRSQGRTRRAVGPLVVVAGGGLHRRGVILTPVASLTTRPACGNTTQQHNNGPTHFYFHHITHSAHASTKRHASFRERRASKPQTSYHTVHTFIQLFVPLIVAVSACGQDFN